MKMKMISRLVLVSMLTLAGGQSAFAITELGENPFYSPPLQSTDDLYTMIQQEKDQIKIGLKAVGLRPVYDSLMDQIATAEVREVSYPKGTTMEWMFYRPNGNGPLRIDNGVIWESDTPFTGYEFDIEHEGEVYTFTVPQACGNLALLKVGEPQAPVVVAPTPEPVVEEPAPEPVAPVVAPEPKKLWFVGDLGMYRQFDPATYLLARVGVEYFFRDNLSVLGMVGAAPKLEGTDGSSAALVDAFLNWYSSSPVWAGIGIGGWITGDDDNDTEDSDLDLILNIGAKVYEKPEAYDLSVFAEARAGFDELDDAKDYGYVGAGVRVRF